MLFYELKFKKYSIIDVEKRTGDKLLSVLQFCIGDNILIQFLKQCCYSA